MKKERFEALYLGIGELVRDHMMAGEVLEREKVYEALSALGMMSAIVILGAQDAGALDYFLDTVFENITEAGKELGAPLAGIEGYRAAFAFSKRGGN